jgi:hypothetical protein
VETDSGSRSFSDGDAGWPETPGELLYNLDLVQETFQKAQDGRTLDLLEELLDCVNWREQFGSTGSGFLRPEQIAELKRYYRAKFAGLERYYLAEQLSTELMSALLAHEDVVFSDALRRLGRDQPELWQEIRAFFSRKEVATATLALADAPRQQPG